MLLYFSRLVKLRRSRRVTMAVLTGVPDVSSTRSILMIVWISSERRASQSAVLVSGLTVEGVGSGSVIYLTPLVLAQAV